MRWKDVHVVRKERVNVCVRRKQERRIEQKRKKAMKEEAKECEREEVIWKFGGNNKKERWH